MPDADAPASGLLAQHRELLATTVREAGALALSMFQTNLKTWTKGASSPVSEADIAVNDLIERRLRQATPSFGWLSEESADDSVRLGQQRVWIVDPIDGTRAFLEGNSTWCVSVAVVEEGRSLAGVLECPAKAETYWATPGSGAFCNGSRINIRQAGAEPEVAGPKVFVDQLPADLLERVRRVTYVPSLAYRLAMIAAGTLDASFVKPNSHDWDIAAAALILNEAGGKLVDAGGCMPLFAQEKIRHGALAAGSGELFGLLSAVIAGRDIV